MYLECSTLLHNHHKNRSLGQTPFDFFFFKGFP
jgi:hypothetical protein